MKYLVTGGAGFIGSNITEELLKRGGKVVVLDNFSTGKRENIRDFKKDIELIEGDIRNTDIVNKAVKGIDIILHYAALISVPLSVQDPAATNEINIGGTLNLLEAAKRENVKRFILASTSAVYGDSPELPKNENMKPNPISPYAISKLTGEYYCNMYSNLYGLHVTSFRYFNVFGPRQDPDSEYSAVIPKFIKLMLNDQSPVIFGDGKQTRDFAYVKDIVDANMLSIENNHKSCLIMNCACNKKYEINEIVLYINELLNKNIKPVFSSPRIGEIEHSYADISLIQRKLNYNPSVSLREGIKNIVMLAGKSH